MKLHKKIFAASIIGGVIGVVVLAQSGGTYNITQSVVSNGGGTSNGGTFSITGTAGQPVAGANSTGGQFGVRGGFWQAFFAPTAAMVAVSGRSLDAYGGPISKVRVTLTDGGGVVRSALTNGFGYFRFDDVEAGQTCIISVQSKRFQFGNPVQVVFVGDEVTDLVFVALPGEQISKY